MKLHCRKHFPEIMKSHQSHDVVLMCIKCHLLTEKHSNIFKMKLAILCEADIDPPKVTHSREIKKIRNFAKALLTSGKNDTLFEFTAHKILIYTKE